MLQNLKLPHQLVMLTGLPKEVSKPSKTKDNVDLVGLSPLPPSLNLGISLKLET
jgi:hypothetical protein